MHHVEAWNEAVCDGAWGRPAARVGEKIRQALDLEHWAAFQGCFAGCAVLLEDVAAGRRGPAPATIVLLSGDVHHAYVAEAWFPGRDVDEPGAAGHVLADPQPARQARAPAAAVGVHAARGVRRARASREPRAWSPCRCAGRSRRSRRSTTRSRAWTCAGARPRCEIEKTVPQDWQAPRLHSSLSLGIAPKQAATGSVQ